MTPSEDERRQPQYVDVTIVEFAVHTAYLDPLTGVGYLVMPRPETDVAAFADPLVEAAWAERLNPSAGTEHLSLHGADRARALSHLAGLGWAFLYDEDGQIETAGTTTDGRQVLCIHGDPTGDDPTMDTLDCAIIALDIAANLNPER